MRGRRTMRAFTDVRQYTETVRRQLYVCYSVVHDATPTRALHPVGNLHLRPHDHELPAGPQRVLLRLQPLPHSRRLRAVLRPLVPTLSRRRRDDTSADGVSSDGTEVLPLGRHRCRVRLTSRLLSPGVTSEGPCFAGLSPMRSRVGVVRREAGMTPGSSPCKRSSSLKGREDRTLTPTSASGIPAV